VRVRVSDALGQPVSQGSGVVVDSGYVITNCHVTNPGDRITVKIGNDEFQAAVALADEVLDLCRLAVSGLNAPAVTVGSLEGVRTGQRVYAIGAPHGLELTISEGIVSSLRQVKAGTVIQTTAPISPGSSGGGLFDAGGKLVGIVTFQHRYGQNLNFAIPADWIAQMQSRTQ
jgi:S1-C subfamily serine protease